VPIYDRGFYKCPPKREEKEKEFLGWLYEAAKLRRDGHNVRGFTPKKFWDVLYWAAKNGRIEEVLPEGFELRPLPRLPSADELFPLFPVIIGDDGILKPERRIRKLKKLKHILFRKYGPIVVDLALQAYGDVIDVVEEQGERRVVYGFDKDLYNKLVEELKHRRAVIAEAIKRL